MDTRTKTVFYDKLTFINLEMPKFRKGVEQLENRFEKWMYVLKNLPRLQALPSQFQEKIFEKIFRVAEIAKMTVAEAAEYENSLKVYRDWYSVLGTARNEGKIEGKIEEKNETALKMLDDGMSIENVSKYTGLSKEQIGELIKMNENENI
jgi:predicted transposase/invertase (TIGR01784 family)